jgi:hypothetical protein
VLKRAWDNSTIPGHAVAFALNSQGDGLLNHVRFGEVLLSENPDDEEDDFEVEGELSALFEELQPGVMPAWNLVPDVDRTPLAPSNRGSLPEPSSANPETLVAAAAPEAHGQTSVLLVSAAGVLVLAIGAYAARWRLRRTRTR